MPVHPAVRARAGQVKWQARRTHNALRRAVAVDRSSTHLVPEPVFILCSVRSGSTLLRSVLDTHGQICAPHELHLGTMRVSTAAGYATDAWESLGMTLLDMENMLWDRGLHRELVRSGKRIVVDKTPQNAKIWPRISAFWPRARYLHLRRHPAHILRSLAASRPDVSAAVNLKTVTDYGTHLDAARAALPGLTVRYEDLTTDPEATLREICGYLGTGYQARMLHYKRSPRRSGLGDWSENIRSGRIQPHPALPPLEETPTGLHDLITRWGY